MALDVTNLSRVGEINGATGSWANNNALFLKVFAGEVLTTFQEQNKFMDKQIVRTISSGKSAQFPVVGTASAAWHTPGQSLIVDNSGDNLSSVNQNERIIYIDDCLVSSIMVDDLDSMKNHWDHRSEYSSLIGRALAKEADTHILASILAAAQTLTANVTGGPTTATITKADSDTVVADLISGIFDAAQLLDEADVPKEDRWCAVQPGQYYNLCGVDSKLVNRDYTGEGNGDIASGVVVRVAGFNVIATNNFGSGDLTGVADAGTNNDPFPEGGGQGYNGNWENVEAICFHRSCAGTVKLADMQVLTDYQTDRLAWLLLARYAMGHSYLRPEAATCIKST